MKKLLLLSLFVLLVWGKGWATSYVDDANCVAAYLFTEGSGTTVDNAQGTATRDGNFKGAGEPAWYNTSLPQTYTTWAADFDGSNDYINCSNNNGFDVTTNWTMMCWVNFDTLETTGNASADFMIGKDDVNQRSYGFCTSGFDNNCYLRMQINGSWIDWGNQVSSTGVWYHAAVRYNTSDDYITFNLDGVEYQRQKTGTPNVDDPAVTTSTLYLGQRGYSGYTEPMNGKITETAIFSRTLSSTEIADIRDNGLKPAAVTRRMWTFQ